MFNRLKDRARITDQDPSFKARYIGCTETFTASGRGCTTPLVQRLWDNAEEERFLGRVHLKITQFGIHMRNMDKKKVPERLFAIENISFCNVDLLVNERIFSWISRESDEQMWECHAVYCSSPEKAKSLALVLTRAFHLAYKEWKSTQTREIRTIERHNRAQSLPAMSLDKKTKSKTLVTKQKSIDRSGTSVLNRNIVQPPITNGYSPQQSTDPVPKREKSDSGRKVQGRNIAEDTPMEKDIHLNNCLDQTISDKSDISSLSKNSDLGVQTTTQDLKL